MEPEHQHILGELQLSEQGQSHTMYLCHLSAWPGGCVEERHSDLCCLQFLCLRAKWEWDRVAGYCSAWNSYDSLHMATRNIQQQYVDLYVGVTVTVTAIQFW